MVKRVGLGGEVERAGFIVDSITCSQLFLIGNIKLATIPN